MIDKQFAHHSVRDGENPTALIEAWINSDDADALIAENQGVIDHDWIRILGPAITGIKRRMRLQSPFANQNFRCVREVLMDIRPPHEEAIAPSQSTQAQNRTLPGSDLFKS